MKHDATEHTSKRTCVLLNGGSGKTDAEQIAVVIRSALSAIARNYEVWVLDRDDDIASSARSALQEGFEIIVAAGGDGTIAAVASALRGRDASLGIIPLGTFNYFARSLDVPIDIASAVQLLGSGARRPMRVGDVNGRIFLNNASLGAYPTILRTREQTYRRWGRSRLAAYWSVLVTLATLRRPLKLTIEANGGRISRRTPLAFAVNNAFQLDQMGLEGREHIAEGRLALFIAPDTGRWGMLRNALALAMGRAQHDVDFDMITADSIRIETRRRSCDVAFDGERERIRAPLELKVVEDALTVIVPPNRQGDTR
ncbi:diacylglycerol/lipid kinase family protein [Roseovarius sp. Pro17]|uniref:diacylglycerol/lipid kinase family protein n=1 Tax=Roseovarius sp. Pro17 TaxID=3108175 RepID=UPI002D773635|nr:diacylglycerol kinase family protein [Roseovarius sp. Pro17]